MRRFPPGVIVVGPRGLIVEPDTVDQDDDSEAESDDGDVGGPHHLARLCIELSDTTPQAHREANEFLRRHRERLGLEAAEGSLLSAFLERVWPDGVPTTLIASNVSFKPQYPEWLLRPVSWGPEAERYAAAHQTLAMHVYRRQRRLVVRRFEVTPHVPPRGHEVVLTAPLLWNPTDLWMEAEDLEALGRLPFHRAQTGKRLELWRQYLSWKEELVKKLQIKVPYLAWTWVGESQLAFLVASASLGNRKLNGQGLSVIPVEEEEEEEEQRQTERPSRRKREADPVELGEVDRVVVLDSRDERTRERWGARIQEGQKLHQVFIRLDEDDARRFHQKEALLPLRGVLISAIAGELAPLRNQDNAITRLQNSQGFCPRLADFLFTATSASQPAGPAPELEPLPGALALNPGQFDAVAKALAAPDLCLIQGPPGTGKTTVIAELCLRVTAQGGRVLVASQTNLAVDNALSRLADRPHIRRLRLGNLDRVDEDYRDFLADRVVDRWFSTIAEACVERVEQTSRLEHELGHARERLAALETEQKVHEEALATLNRIRKRLDGLGKTRAPLTTKVRQLREHKDELRRELETLQAAQAWANGHQVEPAPLPAGLVLPELEPFALEVRAQLAPEDPVATHSGLALLSAVRGRTADLEALRDLLAEGRRYCLTEGQAGAQTELASLLALRQRLSVSEDETDTARLPALNKKIKQLQGEAWSQLTRRLVENASRVLAGAPWVHVQQLTDSLRPNSNLIPSIEVLEALVSAALRASQHLERALPTLARALEARAQQTLGREEEATRKLREAEGELSRLETEREQLLGEQHTRQQEVDGAHTRWNQLWRGLQPASESPPLPSAAAVQATSEQLRQQHQDTETQLERRRLWGDVQKEWLGRLARVSESDRQHLQSLYIQHANVVGMTCNEAGKKAVYQAPGFQPFDMVIIDEVSKATPTELIMPMLLGRKVVLVGDHRQLPPMFREREASFGEAQAEGAIDAETFKKYQRMVTASLFQELFEAAPDSLKAMLWVQYRMHPQVMDAVNQFYGGRLQPGARPGEANPREALGARRQHHLRILDDRGGLFLEPGQHLLWVDSSKDASQRPYREEQDGTSKRNSLEVKLVLETLRRLNRALWERGYGQSVQLQVERAEAGQPMREFVRKRLCEPPSETLDNLFDEKRVRVEGRSQKPGRLVQTGERIDVDARRQVGVLTFYGSQLRALRKAIDEEDPPLDAMELRTNTVDRFQGMERPIIIASLVRSVPGGHMGEFVRQFQRINVGLSRAQELLVIIGAADTFKQARIDLPPLDGGAPQQVGVYHNIFELAVRSGGRRHAWQLLG